MTTKVPPSIGDKAKNFKLVVEEVPLPGTRKEVISAISNLLESGGVQRLLIQMGSPIRVHRYVKDNDLGPIKELMDDNLFNAARNARMDEQEHFVNVDAFRSMFESFAHMTNKGVVPIAVIVHSTEALRKWMGLAKAYPLKEVYGVEVVAQAELPDDVGIFVCADPSDVSVVTYSLKFVMEEARK